MKHPPTALGILCTSILPMTRRVAHAMRCPCILHTFACVVQVLEYTRGISGLQYLASPVYTVYKL